MRGKARRKSRIDDSEVRNLGVKPILGDYLVEDRSVARHATERVAKELMQLTAARAFTSVE